MCLAGVKVPRLFLIPDTCKVLCNTFTDLSAFRLSDFLDRSWEFLNLGFLVEEVFTETESLSTTVFGSLPYERLFNVVVDLAGHYRTTS